MGDPTRRKAIGSRLALAAKRIGASQRALARQLGVSPATLSHWLAGKNQPDLETLAELCRQWDVSADEILGLPTRGPARIPRETAIKLARALAERRRRLGEVGKELREIEEAITRLAEEPEAPPVRRSATSRRG